MARDPLRLEMSTSTGQSLHPPPQAPIWQVGAQQRRWSFASI
jgi:hypothetical protein